MERRVRISLAKVVGAALLAFAFLVCSNPIDIVGAVSTEVKVANKKFLVVQTVGPVLNATGINPGAPFLITFDRDVDMTSLATGITVTPEPGCGFKYDFNQSTKTLSVLPDPFLKDNTIYTVTITKGVKGADGSDLQNEYSWAFKTGTYPAGNVKISGTKIGETLFTASTGVTATVSGNFSAKLYRIGHAPTDFSNFTDLTPATFTTLSNPTITVSDTLPTGDGVKTLYVQFLDNSNSSDLKLSLVTTDTITLDTTAPTVSAGSVSTLYTGVTTRTTNGSASDVSGISAYSWSVVSGSPAGSVSFGTPNTLVTTYTAVTDGTCSLRLTATDGLGHSSSATTSTFLIDRVPPNAPSFGTVTTPTVESKPTWSWTSGGGGGSDFVVVLEGVGAKGKFSWDGKEPKGSTSFPGAKNLDELLGRGMYPLVPGTCVFRVAELDPAGNRSAWATSTIEVVPALPLNGAALPAAAVIRLQWIAMPKGYTVYADIKNPPAPLKDTPNNYFDIPADFGKPGMKVYWYVRGSSMLPPDAPKTVYWFKLE